MSKNLSELSGRQGLKNNMFDKMGQLAQERGTVSKEEMASLADEFLFGQANAFGTTTFYDFLKPENQGKKAYYCNGSACLCAGTQDKVKEELGKHYQADEIGHMCCLGRCHENSAFHIDGTNYSGADLDKLGELVNGDDDREDQYNVRAEGTQVLTENFPGIQEYYAPLKSWLDRGRDELLKEIKDSGIRGRGGAGFPMGFKFEACKKEESDQKFIICNADEGDPGAYSDRYLLEKQPHAVLLGMMVAGYIIGAEWGVLYIRAEYPESIDIIEKAIAELHENNWLGESILGSSFNFQFKVIKAQGAYICGEETALISSIEGQRPEVRVRPPYPVQRGLFNRPTVVNNVETLAAIPWIINNTGEKYAQLGTERSSGTKLISLDHCFNKPGIYEVEMGTSLSHVVDGLGQGFSKGVKALHIGGPLGGLVPVDKIPALTVDFESFGKEGFLLGHASVVGIPEDFPIIDYLEHLFDFAAYESCGKCFPCRLGTHRAWEMITKAKSESYKIDRQLFDDLLETLEKGSLCAHGGGIPLPVKNALQYFESELNEYFESPVLAQ